jgi:hypothetical protein
MSTHIHYKFEGLTIVSKLKLAILVIALISSAHAIDLSMTNDTGSILLSPEAGPEKGMTQYGNS